MLRSLGNKKRKYSYEKIISESFLSLWKAVPCTTDSESRFFLKKTLGLHNLNVAVSALKSKYQIILRSITKSDGCILFILQYKSRTPKHFVGELWMYSFHLLHFCADQHHICCQHPNQSCQYVVNIQLKPYIGSKIDNIICHYRKVHSSIES